MNGPAPRPRAAAATSRPAGKGEAKAVGKPARRGAEPTAVARPGRRGTSHPAAVLGKKGRGKPVVAAPKVPATARAKSAVLPAAKAPTVKRAVVVAARPQPPARARGAAAAVQLALPIATRPRTPVAVPRPAEVKTARVSPKASPTKATAGLGERRVHRAAAPATRLVRIKALDPCTRCGPNTSVEQLYRVDEQVAGTATVHLVFFDRHGWYCVHGASCVAVRDVHAELKAQRAGTRR